MFGNIFGDLEEQQAALKAELEKTNVEGSAGDGAITVTANALGVLTNISIDTSKLDMNDVEEVEDLMLVAVNNVLDAAAAKEADASEKLIQDMLPPGMENLFGRG